MNEGDYPDPPPDEDEALLRERQALVFQLRGLQERTRRSRAASREIASRCVEGRITRQHRAARIN